jgi:hypothetical protein
MGHASTGEPGSPYILHQFGMRHLHGQFRLLCCEHNGISARRLLACQDELPRAEIQHGRYQDLILPWLDTLDIPRTQLPLGLVYCDPNGAKDLKEGYDIFHTLAWSRRWRRLDFLFHFSLTAYKRSAGVGLAWADTDVSSMVDTLAALKTYTYMRELRTPWQWVLMHGLNTAKVTPVWKKEGITRYADWRNRSLQEAFL